jgi:uncharacterized protein (TIGR03435 family)
MKRALFRLISVFPIAAMAMPAQEFDVASVKPAAPPAGRGIFVGIRGGPGTQDPNRISYVNESLRNLLSEAYSVRLFQVFGPAWIDTERFDIVATLPPNSTREQSRAMLQKLITDRFHAAIHREQREFPVFDLTIAKSGAKLTPAAATDKPGASMSADNGQARLTVTKGTIADFIRSLETEAGAAILDQTRITGVFNFTVEFTRDTGRVMNQFTGLPQAPPSATTENAGNEPPGLSTALQGQLGLKLDRTKGRLDAIVVDRADKTPAGN